MRLAVLVSLLKSKYCVSLLYTINSCHNDFYAYICFRFI